ncbi:hypothetical protein FQA39_LY04220 [Lamprigera yunnana]|nr:hypothetical protein FQA39_LY04220 [Lamprigera yunnana]
MLYVVLGSVVKLSGPMLEALGAVTEVLERGSKLPHRIREPPNVGVPRLMAQSMSGNKLTQTELQDLTDNLDDISDYDMEAESEQYEESGQDSFYNSDESNESYIPSNISKEESQKTEVTESEEETTATYKIKKQPVAVTEPISHTQIADVDVNEDDDWDAVRVKLGDALRLDDFVSVDNDVITSETMDMNEIITNHIFSLQEDNDEEEVEAVDILNPSRNKALAAISVLRRFINVSCSQITDVTSDLNRMENAIINGTGSNARQTTIFDF